MHYPQAHTLLALMLCPQAHTLVLLMLCLQAREVVGAVMVCCLVRETAAVPHTPRVVAREAVWLF